MADVENKALAVKAKAIGELLEKNKEAIARALPKHLTAERLVRVASTAIFRTPSLIECDQRSIINAVVIASQMGLEPDGVTGMAYLVPFNTKTGKVAQLIIGYKGLIDLARRSGQISDIYAEPVYTCDKFEIVQGTERKIVHVPNYDAPEHGKHSAMKGCYAVALLKDGTSHFEYMTAREIDSIRQRSRAKDSGPWVTDPIAMSLKTVLRRLCRLLPQSIELRTANATQDAAEAGESQSAAVHSFIDVPFEEADIQEEQAEAVDKAREERGKKIREDYMSKISDLAQEKGLTVFDDLVTKCHKSNKEPDADVKTWSTPNLSALFTALSNAGTGE